MALADYGITLGPRLTQWPASGGLQEPDDYRPYSYSASAETLLGTDAIVGASLSVRPSGAGEVVASRLGVSGVVVTAWMAGGVPGRSYLVRIDLTMASGTVREVLIRLPMDATLAVLPMPDAPSLGFGAVLAWPAVTAFGILGADLAQLVGADGALLTFA